MVLCITEHVNCSETGEYFSVCHTPKHTLLYCHGITTCGNMKYLVNRISHVFLWCFPMSLYLECLLTNCHQAETQTSCKLKCAICSQPLLCSHKTDKLHPVACKKCSSYFPEYPIHILPLNELLLFCSCMFVVERKYSYFGRAKIHIVTK